MKKEKRKEQSEKRKRKEEERKVLCLNSYLFVSFNSLGHANERKVINNFRNC